MHVQQVSNFRRRKPTSNRSLIFKSHQSCLLLLPHEASSLCYCDGFVSSWGASVSSATASHGLVPFHLLSESDLSYHNCEMHPDSQPHLHGRSASGHVLQSNSHKSVESRFISLPQLNGRASISSSPMCSGLGHQFKNLKRVVTHRTLHRVQCELLGCVDGWTLSWSVRII